MTSQEVSDEQAICDVCHAPGTCENIVYGIGHTDRESQTTIVQSHEDDACLSHVHFADEAEVEAYTARMNAIWDAQDAQERDEKNRREADQILGRVHLATSEITYPGLEAIVHDAAARVVKREGGTS